MYFIVASPVLVLLLTYCLFSSLSSPPLSSRLDGNHAGELGGGIHCFECVMWATNSSFDSNTANGDGGGMRLSSASTVTVNLCTFSGNEGSVPFVATKRQLFLLNYVFYLLISSTSIGFCTVDGRTSAVNAHPSARPVQHRATGVPTCEAVDCMLLRSSHLCVCTFLVLTVKSSAHGVVIAPCIHAALAIELYLLRRGGRTCRLSLAMFVALLALTMVRARARVCVSRLLFVSFSAVYDGGAIAVDTSGSSSNGAEELAGASTQAVNGTSDGVSVELVCQNTTFYANFAGERGGSLYSNTVSLFLLFSLLLLNV